MAAKRSKGLVENYLERVSGSLLEDQYRPLIAGMIKGRAGVYALYKGERLYYVGLATNLMNRVKQHLKDRHARQWDTFSVYLAVDGAHIKPLESLLLRIAQPPGNKVKGKLPGARDEKQRLRKDMSEADVDRHARLLGGQIARKRVRQRTAAAKGTRVLAGIATKRRQLRADYKGRRYLATLRKDGTISFDGKIYDAPSSAAKALLGRNANGWQFWKYRDGRNGWVPLARMKR